MTIIRYKFSIDDDVIKKYSIRLPVQIAYYVMIYLNDPNGWSKKGFFFEESKSGHSIIIRMASAETIQRVCGDGSLSCAELNGKRMYINADRWFHGSSHSRLSLEDYRQYLVSHEIGHILGHEHDRCKCKGCPAPIMMQQTNGIGKCSPNTEVFK